MSVVFCLQSCCSYHPSLFWTKANLSVLRDHKGLSFVTASTSHFPPFTLKQRVLSFAWNELSINSNANSRFLTTWTFDNVRWQWIYLYPDQQTLAPFKQAFFFHD